MSEGEGGALVPRAALGTASRGPAGSNGARRLTRRVDPRSTAEGLSGVCVAGNGQRGGSAAAAATDSVRPSWPLCCAAPTSGTPACGKGRQTGFGFICALFRSKLTPLCR